MAGLRAVPGLMIRCPRILEVPVAFECRQHVTIALSATRQIILGRIEMAHVRKDIIDLDRDHSDPARLDAVGRMGGDGYPMTRQVFDCPTPSTAEVMGQRPETAPPVIRGSGRTPQRAAPHRIRQFQKNLMVFRFEIAAGK